VSVRAWQWVMRFAYLTVILSLVPGALKHGDKRASGQPANGIGLTGWR
jgi:hypothetical protein